MTLVKLKNKLSLLLLISVLSLKASDSLRKRTVQLQFSGNYYFLNRYDINSKFIIDKPKYFDFDGKVIFGKRKIKHTFSLIKDTYFYNSFYNLGYEVKSYDKYGIGYTTYYHTCDVNQIITYKYYSFGYGISREYSLSNKFILQPQITYYNLLFKRITAVNSFDNFSQTVVEEDLINKQKSYYTNRYYILGRIGLNLSLNTLYMLTDRISIITGLSFSTFYGGNYQSNWETKSRTFIKNNSKINAYGSTTSQYDFLKSSTILNFGINYKIKS